MRLTRAFCSPVHLLGSWGVLSVVTAALGPSALVGREIEVAVLRRAVDEARAGTGGVVLVTGEAGIGKSRLVREAALYAREAGLTVLSGRAVPQGGAYRPLVDALLGQLRDATMSESPELRPFRSALSRLIPGWSGSEAATEPAVDSVVVLGEGLVRLLRRVGGDAGCLVVLDDLHWADADSLALLEFLAGAVGTSRILAVGAARTDERWHRDRLMLNENVLALALDRFGRDDIVGLISSRLRQEESLSPGFEELIVARSEGVPLVVEELLAGLVESGALTPVGSVQHLTAESGRLVPAGLAALVARRLGSLTEDQRKVVHAAAVLGREVDWALLPLVAALDEDSVLE
ncbi:AAA ATPase-like protein [Kribbella sp. VKM Ac-2527]|uniref:AAA ATPase-like protein n=1 Tax=Kribbella caucasensis TaxID=2512215 RepID=A0A4R6KFE7_9ACTN|nr:AAA ATPase-like protein [Kribbella sp. VKM Ac-2527]